MLYNFGEGLCAMVYIVTACFPEESYLKLKLVYKEK